MRKFLAFFISFCLSVTSFAQVPTTSNQQFADIQLNQNPGFENGKVRYVNGGGSFATTTTNPFMGKVSATWQATGAGQYLKTVLMPIPYGLQGNKCSASFAYTGGDSNVNVQVFDASANPLSQQLTLSLRTAWTDPQAPAVLNFTCPTTSVYVQWTATAASATLYLDQVLVGSIARDRALSKAAANAIELLANPGAENSSAVTGWTLSGGSSSIVQPGASGFMFGTGTFKWQASASGQTFQSGALPIYGLANGLCSAQMFYTYAGTAGDYTLSVSNGTSTLNSLALPINTFANSPVTLTFGCGTSSSSTLNFILTSNVASPSPIYFDNLHLGTLVSALASSAQPMTITRYLSGTGTYTVPVGATAIRIIIAGGGGGGAGSGTSNTTAAAAGSPSTFSVLGGAAILTAGGGSGAAFNSTPGAGGSATVASPAVPILALAGGQGSGTTFPNNGTAINGGGVGGSNPLGGAGAAGGANFSYGAGAPNTGAGGGGASAGGGNYPGPGGGAGAYIDAIISSPSPSYTYAVGAGGAGGVASNLPGGAGGSGQITIQESYNQIGNAYPSTNGGLSPGDEVSTGAATCPIGTIPEDGSSYSTSAYPQLFAALGYKYGGSGANFSVPNGQGVTDRGAGSQVIGGVTYTGTQGTTQGDQMQGHIHDLVNSVWQPTGGTFLTGSGSSLGIPSGPTTGPLSDGTNGTPRVGAETRMANIVHLKCIRTGYSSGADTIVGAVQSADNMNGITVVNSTQTYTSSATLTTAIETAFVDATAGAVTITLPASGLNKGKKFYITKIDSSANAVTIIRSGSDVIGNSLTQTLLLTPDDTAGFTADGAGKWRWLTSPERTIRTQVTAVCSSSPCTIKTNTPSNTVTRSAAGTYSDNFLAGSFSDVETCVSTSSNSAVYGTYLGTQTVTAATVVTTTTGGGVDGTFNVNCTGPR